MDFSEAITALADKAQKEKGSLSTEEATKTALVMPFIRALGYDVFNPREVVPEFIADIAGKKGERVDYAIMQDGKPIMIIECKCYGVNLDDVKRDQLHSYFLALDSSIGILTDGIRYLFFSTADDGKHMDTRPFMEFSLDNIDSSLLPEIRKLCKGKFDLKTTLDTVNELKYNRQIKILLARNLEAPGDGFISYFMSEAGVKRATPRIREQFTAYTKRAFKEFIDEQVDAIIKKIRAGTSKKEEAPQAPVAHDALAEPEITENEYQALYFVKSILMGTVAPERVFLRNVIGIGRSVVVLDDSIRKPVLRINFNKPEKLSIGIIGEDKKDNFVVINTLDDMLHHAETIRETARRYDSSKKKG